MTKESKKSTKEEKKPVVPAEENIQETIPEVPAEPVEPEGEKPTQIAAKQFVKILKEEFKGEIKESIYTAFLGSVPAVDWEKNYRSIWETTFKRPPTKK